MLYASVVIQTVGKRLVVEDVSGHVIVADGLEAVRIVVRRVGLAEKFPAAEELRRPQRVFGERQEAGVIGQRRFQVVVE